MSSHFERAQILYYKSRFALAVDELHRELAIDPNCALSYALLAKCQMVLGDHAQARLAAERAVGIAPEEAYAHNALAWAHYYRGDYISALAACDEMLRLQPDDADNLGLDARVRSALDDEATALASAERGLAIDARHRVCREIRAWALYYLDRDAEAENAAREALAIWPENVSLLEVLGWCLLTLERPGEAEASFREALRIAPTEGGARRGLLKSLRAQQPLFATGPRTAKSLQAVWSVVRHGFPKDDAERADQAEDAAANVKPNMARWKTVLWVTVYLIVLLIVVDVVVWSIGVLLAYQSISTLLVLRHAAHRHLPSGSEWRGALTVGVALFVLVVLLALGMDGGRSFGFVPAIVAAVLIPAAVASARCVEPRRRWGLATLTLLLAIAGLWQPVLQAQDRQGAESRLFDSNWPTVVFGLAYVLATPAYLYYYDAKSDK